MSATRRDFLMFTAGAGVSALSSGCVTGRGVFDWTQGAPMHGFAAPKIPHIRLGVVGMGSRGCGVVGRVCNLPGITVTAICDNIPDFTRGAWRTNRPLDIVDIDLGKMGLKDANVKKAEGQISV